TFRTYAAPGKGGDEGQKEYTQKIHQLGYIYGPYNNYTDYSPVNEHWDEDWVTRLPDGNFQPAWARCYNPKPMRAVEVEPLITAVIQKKFNFNTAYCDVHTAVTPWQYVDYDARVPGAGTFASTYYAYGEILLHQKKIWGGPVYSEGNNHWYYSGLTDGNYAQDQAYRIPQNPWLVDFDLLKIHPLENNFGMGNPSMFYGRESFTTDKEREQMLDRFIAATLAFGHTGFLAMEYGLHGAMRSYFMVQAIAKRYGTQKVKAIHYADENGNYLTTSEALAADVVKLNRLRIEYEDGLTLYVNGHNDYTSGKTETLWFGKRAASENLEEWERPLMLVPNSWFVYDPKGELSASCSGACAYIDSPAYMFAENTKYFNILNGKIFCDKQLIVLKNVDDKGSYDLIVGEPNYAARSTIHGIQLENNADADAVAFDFEGKELGKAETRYSNGLAGPLVYVIPVKDAFRYRLTPKAKPDKAIFDELGMTSLEKRKLSMPVLNNESASPGQTLALKIGNKDSHEDFTVTIPPDAKTHSLHWVEKNGLWAAFRIFPLCNVTPIVKQDKPGEVKFRFGIFTIFQNCFMVGKDKISVEFVYGDKKQVQENVPMNDLFQGLTFAVEPESAPRVLPVALKVIAEQDEPKNKLVLEKKYTLKTDWGFNEMPPLPTHFETGYCQRGKPETVMDGRSGAHAYLQQLSCGNKTQHGWGIHPPYNGGVGYTFLLSDAFTVPKEDGIEFSSEVGIRNGGDPSDGVLYQVFVIEDGKEPVLAGEKNWAERSWYQLNCDLSKWQGKEIRLKLVADVGPKDNSTADWAAWANFKLVPTKKVLITVIE
ncbi:MAG: hypothetical protein FWE67_14070, partial [Planctomycetaceae bacterium]|nr:hypothetical protein [Planctomycetaceae bacterium]